jgi:hypothetical protein
MRWFVVALLLLLSATPALAQVQPSEPLPLFVIDARGAFALLKRDPVTATTLDISVEGLPTQGLGIAGGAHLYPLRRGGFAFGIGGELLLARAGKQEFDEEDEPLGPEVRRQLQSLSAQLSFNFGHRLGWSYLTAGIGPASFDTYVADTLPDGTKQMTQNFGFGARWFSTPHLAFTVDIRFYLTQPAVPTDVVGGRERKTLTVFSAGVSIK